MSPNRFIYERLKENDGCSLRDLQLRAKEADEDISFMSFMRHFKYHCGAQTTKEIKYNFNKLIPVDYWFDILHHVISQKDLDALIDRVYTSREDFEKWFMGWNEKFQSKRFYTKNELLEMYIAMLSALIPESVNNSKSVWEDRWNDTSPILDFRCITMSLNEYFGYKEV